MEDDYPWDMGRTDAESEFLAHLRRLSDDRAHFDAWDLYPQLVVTLVVADRFGEETPVVVRTLRVDFDGAILKAGEDPAGQVDPDLSANVPDYFETSGGETIAELAELAFGWFQSQGLRPIDRQEWVGPDRTWLRWVLVEPVERPLVGRYSNRPDRAPDRVIRIGPRVI